MTDLEHLPERTRMCLDARGLEPTEVLAEIDERRAREPDVHGAHLFGLVYPSGRSDFEALMAAVYERYLFGNALNPFAFPELAGMEGEVVSMVGDLVHLPEAGGGTMTSGGTESILMSMLVARGRAQERGIDRPQILAPESAHPAYAKAAHYFGMEVVRVPLDAWYRADVNAAAELIGPSTAVVIASALSYPHGAADPVPELAALAARHGVSCHVDACIAGLVYPFLERLGRPVPEWDFRVDGVTEISADVHKYGYSPKGASVILHRDPDWFGHQVFLYDRWGAGLYGSPGVAGARPAAPIAAAWAAMRFLGEDGFVEITRGLMDTVDRLRSGIDGMDGIDIVGDPPGPVLATHSDTIDLYGVADAMDDRGWRLNRNTDPRGIHMMVSPAHGAIVDSLLSDLREAVRTHGPSRGVEARYA